MANNQINGDSFNESNITIYTMLNNDNQNLNEDSSSFVVIEQFKFYLIKIKNNDYIDNDIKKLFINFLNKSHRQQTIINYLDKFDYFLIEIIIKILVKLNFQVFNRLEIFEFFMSFYLKVQEKVSKSITLSLNFEHYCFQMNKKNLICYLSKLKTDHEKDYVFKIFTKINIIDVLIFRNKDKNIYEYLINNFYSKEHIHKVAPLSIVLENRFIKYSLSYFSTFVIQRYIERFKSLTVIQILNNNMNKFVTNKNGVFILITTFKNFDSSMTTYMVEYIINYCSLFYREKYYSIILEFVLTYFDYCLDMFLSRNSDMLIGKSNYFLKNFIIYI